MFLSQDAVIFIFPTTSVVQPRFYTPLGTFVARHPLRELGRASHNQLFPGGRGRDRSQEFEQLQKAVAPFDSKADAQRQGHRLLAQRRHEAGASLFPKRTLDEEAQPPLAPPLEGAAVDRQGFPQPLDPFGLQAVDHGRHQYHDQPGINSPPQEAHRGRGMPPSAALLGATKTEAHLPLRTAPRLAVIIAAVQLATAKQAALQPSLLGQIGIDFFQQLIYLLICQMVLAPAFSESTFQQLRSERKNPRRASSLRGFQLSGVAVHEN